ncbi:MAG: hypothetical protein U1G07_16470 [Verrucomicrobiota bacterium]
MTTSTPAASYKPEAYEVLREIVAVHECRTVGGERGDYGYRVQAGLLGEVTGLNKNPINCQGTFSPTRVSEVGLLNHERTCEITAAEQSQNTDFGRASPGRMAGGG